MTRLTNSECRILTYTNEFIETILLQLNSSNNLSNPKPGHTTGRQDWMPTELFAQETSLPFTLQSIADTSPRLPRRTNKRNPM